MIAYAVTTTLDTIEGAYAQLPADVLASISLLLLTIVGLSIIVWDAFKPRNAGLYPTAIGGTTAALVLEWSKMGAASKTVFSGMLSVNGEAALLNVIILGATLATLLLTRSYMDEAKTGHGETPALLLFGAIGMMALAGANHMVTIFIGLETMSITLYILAGLVRSAEAIESALKYFVLGAFSTGFLLYGMALLYAETGTMYLNEIGTGTITNSVTMLAGVGLLLVGFMFKISAVPFHMWTPDVYQGAPTPLTGYMSTAGKASAFMALFLVTRHVLHAGGDVVLGWTHVMAVFAVLSMVFGNLIALAQQNVKRMLAYSSVAHAGYILVGLASGTEAGIEGGLYYLIVYAIMNVGAFAAIGYLERDGKQGAVQTVADLNGLGYKHAFLGVALTIFLFSLAGFPPFAGFLGKYAVFAPALAAGRMDLVVVGVLASAASAYYYLRILVALFMTGSEATEEEADVAHRPLDRSGAMVIAVSAILLIVMGLWPALIERVASLL